ncbi:phage holin family protein [Clostridiaceae bacterium M8S5]|nr:phage holin family protein [Clostridiaceae bacterium M8S5]
MQVNAFKFLLGSLSGLIVYIAGLNFELILLWFVFLVLDIFSGLLKAFKTRHFSSQSMRLGLSKKVAEIILLCAIITAQRILAINCFDLPLLEIFICALCLKEFGSIIENCNTMGVRIPEFIMKWLRAIDDDIDKEEKDVNNKG